MVTKDKYLTNPMTLGELARECYEKVAECRWEAYEIARLLGWDVAEVRMATPADGVEHELAAVYHELLHLHGFLMHLRDELGRQSVCDECAAEGTGVRLGANNSEE